MGVPETRRYLGNCERIALNFRRCVYTWATGCVGKISENLWAYIVFPEIPQLDLKHLNQILDQDLFELNNLDFRMIQRENADTHFFSYCEQILRDNLAEVFQSHQVFKFHLEVMRHSLTVFLISSLQDRTFEKPNRHKRYLLVPIVATALGIELSKILVRLFTAR